MTWILFRKLFFEKMTIGTDLLIMLGIIGVISPVIFIYIVPIIKSKRDFLNEFNNDLTAWQRGLLTSIILSAVLFTGLVSFGQNVIRTETENRSYYTRWSRIHTIPKGKPFDVDV
jgi:hypothetical protein